MTAPTRLPGGIHRDGRHHRLACLYPITGSVEMAIGECHSEALSIPARVTRILTAAVEKVGNLPMSPDLAEEMAIGDRIFLMLRIGTLLAGDEVWRTGICDHCAARFDLCVKRSALAVRSAGPDYPIASVDLNGATVLVRAPAGSDQQWLCDHRPPHPRRALLARCIEAVAGAPPHDAFVAGLSTAERVLLEKTIAAMGPEVVCTLDVACPECGKQQQITFDPYRFHEAADDLEEQIHTLAFYYHWSEPEILSIPRTRRQRYLVKIERERGRHV